MTANEQKNAKLRFIILYVCSLVLIFIVVTAFWKKSPLETAATIQDADDDSYFVQYDTLLHAKMDQLDERYAIYLKNLQNGTKEAAGFLNARDKVVLTLDSIEKQASFLTSGSKKEAMNRVVARYKNSLSIKNRLINELTYLPPKSSQPSSQLNSSVTTNTSDVESLKMALAEKDKKILDLENQVKQKEAALQNGGQVNANGNSNEWKQKYTSLKSSYDRLETSERSLRSAYKTVADDNKRLLGQIQSLKKG